MELEGAEQFISSTGFQVLAIYLVLSNSSKKLQRLIQLTTFF